MHVLFVHQNFPAQFKHVAPWLAREHGWDVTFVTRDARAAAPPGVRVVPYAPSADPTPSGNPCLQRFEDAVSHALGVYDALKGARIAAPDLAVAHSGFGSSLYLPHLYDAPIVNFFEHFFHASGQELGYRPDDAVTELNLLRGDTTNAKILLDLNNCDRGWSPTAYQRGLMPEAYRGKRRRGSERRRGSGVLPVCVCLRRTPDPNGIKPAAVACL